jgi:hypothetical protein
MNQLGAGGGNKDEWPVGIGASSELGRTIVHFETHGHFPAGFAREKRVPEFLSKQLSRFDGGDWKASPAARRGGYRCCGGSDDIDGDNGPPFPITPHTSR